MSICIHMLLQVFLFTSTVCTHRQLFRRAWERASIPCPYSAQQPKTAISSFFFVIRPTPSPLHFITEKVVPAAHRALTVRSCTRVMVYIALTVADNNRFRWYQNEMNVFKSATCVRHGAFHVFAAVVAHGLLQCPIFTLARRINLA